MELEYIATNKISISSTQIAKEYVSICNQDLHAHLRNPECTVTTDAISEILMKGKENTYKVYEGELPLTALSVIHPGYLGFVYQVIYDKKEHVFKLRLFADKKLRERGFESIYEPMRKFLTAAPESLQMPYVKQTEESVEPPKLDFSFEDLEKHARKIEEFWYNDYLQLAGLKLREPEDYEGGYEERCMYEEDMERGKFKSREKKTVIDHFDKNDFITKLKARKSLYNDLRSDFAKRFPEQADVINNTALGVLPWISRNKMHGQFGTLLYDKLYLPTFKDGGFVDDRSSLLEAELIVPPLGECRNIISLYPYTFVNILELNKVNEEAFDDDEILQAMIGHELGEAVIGDAKPQTVGVFDYMLNNERMRASRERWRQEEEERHLKIDKMMVECGLGSQTKKMLGKYKSKLEEILAKVKEGTYPIDEVEFVIEANIPDSIKRLEADMTKFG